MKGKLKIVFSLKATVVGNGLMTLLAFENLTLKRCFFGGKCIRNADQFRPSIAIAILLKHQNKHEDCR